jgi:exonuclease SbcD
MIKILHFADAHIDMANHGRHDPQSGLPLRVIDFLKSLDTIVDAAISEQVDLVLFAGDAYKDRNPAPTFQREWSRRIMRLSHAGIPTILLVGNHDLSPALGRAHALDPFSTLEVQHVQVIDQPVFLKPEKLQGMPLQVLALPWITRSGLIASLGLSKTDPSSVFEQIEDRVTGLVQGWLAECDPSLPTILTAHCSVQGASYGGERTVMLGGDLVLPASLMRDPRLDYVALGHIHKSQDLNEGSHPPVIYPGSIERVDFGEAKDEKYYVIAQVSRGKTEVRWHKLIGVRPFIDRRLRLEAAEGITDQLRAALPPREALAGAIIRLVLEYPRQWESMIDEASLRAYTEGCFEFHLLKRPLQESRIRIPEDQAVGSLTPLDLLDLYWRSNHLESDEAQALSTLAAQVIQEVASEL